MEAKRHERKTKSRWILIASGVACLAMAVVAMQRVAAKTVSIDGTILTHTIARGELLVTVTEQGTLESSNNVEIKCKVRGQNTVIFVVESGSYVEPGDELLRMDTLFIEEQIAERTKYALWSRSGAEHSKAAVARAKLAVEEYVPNDPNKLGRYGAQLMTLKKDLAIAEANLRTAQNRLSHTEMMSKSGYVSELDLEDRTFAVERANLAVEATNTQIEVLENFTKAEELETLRGNLAATSATHAANAERAEADASRRDRAVEELGYCVINAEHAGMVIHPSAARWKNAPEIQEGGTVHKDQILLLMPDLTQMQITVGVHESIVDRIKTGLQASVTLPDKVLDGKVSDVATVTSPAGWWTGNVVKYDTVIKLPETEGLKPGMSAEVEIVIARYSDVVKVPVAAVLEAGPEHFAWVRSNDGSLEQRKLQLGDSNDVYLVVEQGLAEGENVILNPLAHVEEAQRLAIASSANNESTDEANGANGSSQESTNGPDVPIDRP